MRRAAEEQEEAYRTQEEMLTQSSTEQPAATLQPRGEPPAQAPPTTATPSNNPSILGQAVGTKSYKMEDYGSIPSTQSNNTINKNTANREWIIVTIQIHLMGSSILR